MPKAPARPRARRAANVGKKSTLTVPTTPPRVDVVLEDDFDEICLDNSGCLDGATGDSEGLRTPASTVNAVERGGHNGGSGTPTPPESAGMATLMGDMHVQTPPPATKRRRTTASGNGAVAATATVAPTPGEWDDESDAYDDGGNDGGVGYGEGGEDGSDGGGDGDGLWDCDDAEGGLRDVVRDAATRALVQASTSDRIHDEPFNSDDGPRDQALRNNRLLVGTNGAGAQTLQIHTDMPAPPQPLRTARMHQDPRRVAECLARLTGTPSEIPRVAGPTPFIKSDAPFLSKLTSSTIAPTLRDIEESVRREQGPSSALCVDIANVRQMVENILVKPYSPHAPDPVLMAMRPDEGGAGGVPVSASGWTAAIAAVPVLQAAFRENAALAVSVMRRTGVSAMQAENLDLVDMVRASVVGRPVADIVEWCREAPVDGVKCKNPACIVRRHLHIDAIADGWVHSAGDGLCVPCVLYNALVAFVTLSVLNESPRLAQVAPWTPIAALTPRSNEVPIKNLLALPELGNIPCVLIFHPRCMRLESNPVTGVRRIVIPELHKPTGFLPPTTP